ETIIKNAENEAETIIKNAENEARIIEEKDRMETASELERAKRKILWDSKVENRKKLSDFREELIFEVIKMAEKKIAKKAVRIDHEYEKLLFNLIREAIEGIGERKVRIVANRRDTQFLKEHIEIIEESLGKSLCYDVELDLTGETIDCVGGVVVSSIDKKISYYNTLEARLSKAREQLRIMIAEILFEE
ncbi:MAG: V-type ATP synthase subunit E family protein, partial [Candidatus Bathyarchaeota archaeon]